MPAEAEPNPPRPVAIFGAAHLDRLIRTRTKAIPGISNAGTVRETGGGVAFNIARTLARLGVPIRLASRLGRDSAGNAVLDEAHRLRIDSRGIVRTEARPTASYQAVLDADGSLFIGIADSDIYDELTPDLLAPALAAATDAALWLMDANLPATSLAAIADIPHRPPLVACTVSPEKARRLVPILGRFDILFCNRSEAETLLGAGPAPLPVKALAAGLMATGVRAGVVTDGPASIGAWSDGAVQRFPSIPAQVVSVNGAGDALAAGVCYGLALGQPFFTAVPLGLASAALKIEAADPVRPDLTPDMLSARMADAARLALEAT